MLELATAQEDTAGSGYHAVTLFQTLRERGLLEHVLPLLENFTVDPSDAQGVTPAINSALFATLQMRDEANEVLEMARPFDDLPDDTGLPIALGCFAEAAIHAGHVEAAAELFPTLEAFEVPGHRRSLTTGCFAWGSLDSTIARMLVVLGRGEEADARFVAGIEDGDNLGATAWSARSRVDYAAFCLAQGRDDDARRLAQEALDLVEGTELEETRQRAEAILTG